MKLLTTIKTIAGMASMSVLLIGNSTFAQNLIQNPGFSTGDLTGWSQFNAGSITVIPTGGDPGDYAWLNNSLGANGLALGQATALGSVVGAGVVVNYSFDLLGGNQANGGVDFVHIFDENASGGVISQGPGLLGPYFPSASGWTAYSWSFTTVAGSDHVYIEFDATTGAAAGSVDQVGVDNVNLSPVSVPEPAPYSVLAGLGGLASLVTFRRRK